MLSAFTSGLSNVNASAAVLIGTIIVSGTVIGVTNATLSFCERYMLMSCDDLLSTSAGKGLPPRIPHQYRMPQGSAQIRALVRSMCKKVPAGF